MEVSDLGEPLIYATARAAMACYFATLFALVLLADDDRRTVRARRLWTVGWLIYLLHVAAAFHFKYHWSHAEADAATNFQTEIDTGWPIPGGIYFNYVFTAVWTIDVLWWWIAPQNYARRSRGVAGTVHGFLFFMVANATIVFGGGITRWASAAACVALIAAYLLRRK